MNDYPNDSDGDALRRIAKASEDMNWAMEIDYAVAVNDESTGERSRMPLKRQGIK